MEWSKASFSKMNLQTLTGKSALAEVHSAIVDNRLRELAHHNRSTAQG